jgi:hypothetical protein
LHFFLLGRYLCCFWSMSFMRKWKPVFWQFCDENQIWEKCQKHNKNTRNKTINQPINDDISTFFLSFATTRHDTPSISKVYVSTVYIPWEGPTCKKFRQTHFSNIGTLIFLNNKWKREKSQKNSFLNNRKEFGVQWKHIFKFGDLTKMAKVKIW